MTLMILIFTLTSCGDTYVLTQGPVADMKSDVITFQVLRIDGVDVHRELYISAFAGGSLDIYRDEKKVELKEVVFTASDKYNDAYLELSSIANEWITSGSKYKTTGSGNSDDKFQLIVDVTISEIDGITKSVRVPVDKNNAAIVVNGLSKKFEGFFK